MVVEVGGAPGDEHQPDGERQADVADAVDDERLLGGRGGRVLVLPEADQQVRREADALPAQEQAEVVGRHDQHEHGGHEQVEVAEEPAPPVVVGHVADGVDVDQRPDAGDQQHEQRGERVVDQVEVDREVAGLEPGEQALGDLAVLLRATEHRDEHGQADQERADGQDAAEQVSPPVHDLGDDGPADEQDHRAEQRQGDHHPQQREDAVGGGRVDHRDLMHEGSHRSCLSTSAGSRRRPRPSDGSGRWS